MRLVVFGLCLFALAAGMAGCGAGSAASPNSIELLNVSYDPTRELWRELNDRFIPHYSERSGVALSIKQSHGGSASQSRAIIDGLEADVATLAMWFDTDALRKSGLLAPAWEDRLPNRSLPYLSTIVFVVRKGNPKQIKDWPDLSRPGIQIITPDPKTGGNGKLSFLAAWGSVIARGGSEDQARDFVSQIYSRDHIPVLPSGARLATTTFAQKGIGDVHLTWENEAYLEVLESKNELEIIVPSSSIRAEPHVAVIDANVDRKGTRAAAEAYLKYLYSEEAQEIIAKNHYRPIDPKVAERHAASFPHIQLFPVTKIAKDWGEAHTKFFAEGAIFDQVYTKKGKGP